MSYRKKLKAAIPMADGKVPGPIPNIDGMTVRAKREHFDGERREAPEEKGVVDGWLLS